MTVQLITVKNPHKKKRKSITQKPEYLLNVSIADFLNYQLPHNATFTTVEVSNQQGGVAGLIKQRALKRRGAMTGFPDVAVFYNGYSFCFELKDPKNKKAQVAQLHAHEKLRNAGINVFVVKSIDEAAIYLKRMIELIDKSGIKLDILE